MLGVLESAPDSDFLPPAQSDAGRLQDPDYRQLLDALGYDPVSIDELIARTGLTTEAVSSMLLLLELDGHVSSSPGGRYSRLDTLASRASGREHT
jgi:DNA processing protein